MNISEFDYRLPEELIAQHPLPERDASRMLIVDRASQSCEDSLFRSLAERLNDGDVLVLNNTRVFAARLQGQRDPTGGAVELLLLRELRPNVWEALSRPAKRLPIGSAIRFGTSELSARVVDALTNGVRVIEFKSENDALDRVIDKVGEPPLPPYIKRVASLARKDSERYQTIYAHERGAILFDSVLNPCGRARIQNAIKQYMRTNAELLPRRLRVCISLRLFSMLCARAE